MLRNHAPPPVIGVPSAFIRSEAINCNFNFFHIHLYHLRLTAADEETISEIEPPEDSHIILWRWSLNLNYVSSLFPSTTTTSIQMFQRLIFISNQVQNTSDKKNKETITHSSDGRPIKFLTLHYNSSKIIPVR